MQITDSDFTRPKDEYSSYFGRPYDVLVVSDDQTTANMDPWLGEKIHRQICHASWAEHYEETLKVIILATTIIKAYQNSELRHS